MRYKWLDFMLIDKKKNKELFIFVDFTTYRVKIKENEKMNNYLNPAGELKPKKKRKKSNVT